MNSPTNPRQAALDWMRREEEGPLGPEERARLDAWLEADSRHRETYEEVAYLFAVSDEHAAASSIMALRRAALGAERRGRPAWGLAAAGLAAAVAVGWVGLADVSNAPTASPSFVTRIAETLGARAAPESAVYRTRVGQRLTVNMPDGSVATLNTNSILKVAYNDGERGVRLLQGQALFEVAKNKAAPFRVYAGDRAITAVGTVFDVRLDGPKVKVALVEGHVRVAPARSVVTPGAPAPQVDLAAGEVLEAQGLAPMMVAAADVRRAVTWRAGLVEFSGEPLAIAVAEMNRYTDHPLRIADPEIAGVRVSGIFRTSEPELFAHMISQVAPVTAERAPDGSTVLRGKVG